ncbi:MAG: carbohydrate-binding domain-containing protein [Bacteroidaceae bacterium]|nr:carbohydrate-binding domain-containing protein [Bacteroidaceae bacterium]
MKKRLSILTLMLLVVASISTWAQSVCKIGKTEYTSLADAVAAANSGDEVTIIESDTYKIPNLPKNITIKAGEDVNVVFDCVGSASIASIPNGATFEGVTMNFGQNSYHGFQHAGTINMNGCTLNGLFFSYGDMNFNKCTFNQSKAEYMMWDYGKDLTYTDCVFKGYGKFINVYHENNKTLWKLTVSGCKFINSGAANKAALNIKETCEANAELLRYDVTIGEGNTLEGNFPANSESDNKKLVVCGDGLWQVDDRNTTDPTQSLIVVKDAKGNVLYEKGQLVSVATSVAKIGDTEYTSLAEAIAAVGVGETITMIADETNAKGISVPENKNFTVDFGGHTYTVNKPGAGSLNTQTQAFQLLKNSTITFKNGKIECAAENKDHTWTPGATGVEKGIAMIIQNYANLTLEDMTIDGTNIAHNAGKATPYIVSNNCGHVEFKGNTSIIAPAGDFAFDVCKSGTYEEPIVTWNSTGEVKGHIELSGGTFIVAENLTVNTPILCSAAANLTVNEGKTVKAEGFSGEYNSKGYRDNTTGVIIVKNGGDLTIEGAGTINSTTVAYAAIVMTEKGDASTNPAKLTVNGGTFEGQYYGIAGNGNRPETDVTINGGTFNATNSFCIYQPQKGNLTINDGTFNGYTCVGIKSGKLNISGGTFTATGAEKAYTPNSNGMEETGEAIIIDNCDYPGGEPSVSITGGLFTAEKNRVVGSYYGGKKTEPLQHFISGGVFNQEPKQEGIELIAEGFVAVKRADNFWTVERPAEKVEVDETIPEEVKDIVTDLVNDPELQEKVSELAEQNREANEEAVENLELNQTIQLQVVAKKAEVDATEDPKITELTFDVKPVYVTNGEIGEQVSNDKINAPIAFALPVGTDFSYAEVYHRGAGVEPGKGDYLGTLKVTNGAVLVKSKEFSEFDVKLTDEESKLYVSYADAYERNYVPKTELEFFDEILPVYPNAIAFAEYDKDSGSKKSFAELHNNVVYEDESHRWICPSLVLTDISTLTEDQRDNVHTDFYNEGYRFTAEDLTYTRKGTKGLNSVYLPFAFAASDIDSGHASDIKIGVFEKVVEDYAGLEYDFAVFKVEESLEPEDSGVACLVKDVRNLPNDEDYVWNIQKTDVRIETNDDWNRWQDGHKGVPCLDGSLVTINSLEQSGCNIWKIDDTGEFFGTANNGTCFPFRSYLVTSADSGTKLRIAWSDEATGISTIETIDNAKDGIMYNLLGVKVGNDYQGVVIKNGKTMLKK